MNLAEARAMSDMDLNIAVAERCGYLRKDGLYPHGEPCWDKDDALYMATELPDYCKDLNAMHEAEETMLVSKEEGYDLCLWMIIKRDGTRPASWHATARQKAEAFILAMGG